MKFAQKINVPLKIYFLEKIAQDKKQKKQIKKHISTMNYIQKPERREIEFLKLITIIIKTIENMFYE